MTSKGTLAASIARFFALALLALLPQRSLEAHPASLTSAIATVEKDGRYTMVLRFDVLAFALNDTPDRVPDEAMNALLDGPVETLRRRMDEARENFAEQFQVLADAQVAAPARIAFPSADDVVRKKEGPGSPRLPILLEAEISGALSPASSGLAFRFPEQIGPVVLSVERPGEEAFAESVPAGDPSTELVLQLSRGEQPQRSAQAQVGRGFFAVFRQFAVLGYEHILPRGLDHILFVVGLFLLGTRLAPLLWQVTAFTLAHSITLGLALYGWVRVPPAVVEPLIAVSILLVAADNLRSRELRWWRVWVVFAFGLVHGLGFAEALLELRLARSDLLSALLGFNCGVELGQLSVVALAFLAVGWLRGREPYRKAIVIPASACIALVAGYWAFERMLGA